MLSCFGSKIYIPQTKEKNTIKISARPDNKKVLYNTGIHNYLYTCYVFACIHDISLQIYIYIYLVAYITFGRNYISGVCT